MPDQPDHPLPASTETADLGAARDGGNGAGPKEHEHNMDDIASGPTTTAPASGQHAADDPGPATVPVDPAQPGAMVTPATSEQRGDGRSGEPDDGSGDGAGDDGSGDDGGGEGAEGGRKRRRPFRSAVEWTLVIGGALVVALVIRSFLLQAFWIPTASMEPTLKEGDRVLVNKLSYDLHDVNRGDVVVFERPENGAEPHPEDDIKDLIKRVVALPGETIEARDGAVYIDGDLLDEPYLPDGTTTDNLPDTEIPEGHVFVMGDNRGNSQDSRFFGPIDEELIVGRAFIRIFPLGDIGGL